MSADPDRRGYKSEDDTDRDPHQARSRATGGVSDPTGSNDPSTTGTAPNGTFVGRVAGDDSGFEGETGAERRAKVDDEKRSS